MSSFEQPISQLEAKLNKAALAMERIANAFIGDATQMSTNWLRTNEMGNQATVLTAALQLVDYRREAFERAKKATGKVSDEFATMSAGFDDEPSERSVEEQRLLALMDEIIATACRSGFVIEGIRYDPSLVGETDA